VTDFCFILNFIVIQSLSKDDKKKVSDEIILSVYHISLRLAQGRLAQCDCVFVNLFRLQRRAFVGCLSVTGFFDYFLATSHPEPVEG